MKWLQIGLKLVPLVIDTVAAIERFFNSGKGKQKEDAAVAVIAASLHAIETGLDKDILNDPAVEKATRELIQAAVAVQNAIATARQIRNA